MGRILALDYGNKRIGVAVTDSLRMIATPLKFIPTNQLFTFLDEYLKNENVDVIVLGLPVNLKGEQTIMTKKVNLLAKKLEFHFVEINKKIKIEFYNEWFTSKMSLDTMITLGMSKKKRMKKSGYQDQISATLILQSYLESKLK